MANNKKSNKKTSPEKSQAKEKVSNIDSKKAKRKKIFKRVALSLVFIMLTVMVIGFGYVFAILKNTPTLDKQALINLSEPTKLYFRDGTFMTNVQSKEERFVITSEEIPKHLKDAYVSIEDERFYKHGGVDIRRIGGAVINNLKMKLTGSGGLHGASTLTQQLVKNTLLTDEVSIERKIKEAYLSIQIENQFSKDEILTLYLNTIPLGGLAYGVEAASLLYFGKSAKDLSLIQCAYLAGMTQAPTSYSFYNTKNQEDPSRIINRTVTVLGKMLELGYITQEEHDAAVQDARDFKFEVNQKIKPNAMEYQWVSYPAKKQVERDLKKKYGYTDEEVTKMLVNGGLKIHTTIDKSLQDHTQSVLDNFSKGNAKATNEEGVLLLQGAATVLDPYTGEIIAMVGGRGPQKPLSLNRAYDGLKPIGSTAKPLVAYGPAIDQKILTAGSALDDAPLPPAISSKYQNWQPNNWNFKYQGFITPRDAIKNSVNVTTGLTVDKIGMNTAINYGEKLGLKYNSASKTSIAAVSLGQFNNDVNDKDGGNSTILASAFSTFVNNGDRVEPLLYSKVEDASGNVILEAEKEVTNVFKPETAYIMYDMLKGPISGLASQAKLGNMPVIGKTGTTTDAQDLLFAGSTPYYSGAVWIGYDTPSKVTGGSNDAAGLWSKIMQKAHEGLEPKEIKKPSNIVSASVCKDSGLKPSELCEHDPRGGRVYTEMFIKGTEPTSYCETHVSAEVNKLNGKLANEFTPAALKETRIFLNKPNASSKADDYQYVLPSDKDDASSVVPEEPKEPEVPDTDDSDDDKPDLVDLDSLSLKGLKADAAAKVLNSKGITNISVDGDNDGKLTDKFRVTEYKPKGKVEKNAKVTLTLEKVPNPLPEINTNGFVINPFVRLFSYMY